MNETRAEYGNANVINLLNVNGVMLFDINAGDRILTGYDNNVARSEFNGVPSAKFVASTTYNAEGDRFTLSVWEHEGRYFSTKTDPCGTFAVSRLGDVTKLYPYFRDYDYLSGSFVQEVRAHALAAGIDVDALDAAA